ncbi:aminotransferase class I/II-fold pyridoxal phosphate-dependent enzyme [Antrihabitans sp. NCIMB 15449]|uniref:Aminotransferase class I/II-fold pyridoxal phosphate-dependent enzyme n=1 Tax=Antrihabitans spumae TaxID=3373370 RepID=A0ABW7JHD7_9NOCA
MHAAFVSALEKLPRHYERHGYDRYGIEVLRDAVARWYEQRGLPTSRDSILVTSGAQHALALLARTMLAPRDRVVIDHPTYPHAITTLRGAAGPTRPGRSDGCRLGRRATADSGKVRETRLLDSRLPQPDRSMYVEGGPAATRACLSDDRGRDDGGHMPRWRSARAVRAGTTRRHQHRVGLQSVWGGLRIGWIRASPALLERVVQRRPVLDLGTPVVEQLATAILLDGGSTNRPAAIDRLREQRDTLVRALGDAMPHLHSRPPAGGVSLWVGFPTQISSRLAATAPDHGLTLAAGPRFGVGGAFERHLRLPFTLPADRLVEAVGRLARTEIAVTAGATGRHPPNEIG